MWAVQWSVNIRIVFFLIAILPQNKRKTSANISFVFWKNSEQEKLLLKSCFYLLKLNTKKSTAEISWKNHDQIDDIIKILHFLFCLESTINSNLPDYISQIYPAILPIKIEDAGQLLHSI